MDILEKLFTSPVGRALAPKVGLAEPPLLRRGRTMPKGQVVLASLQGATLAAEVLSALDVATIEPLLDVAENRSPDEKGRQQPPRYPHGIGAIVVDATTLRTIDDLELVRQVLRPAVKALEGSGRVILLASDASAVEGLEAKAVAQALDGIDRTVGKELRKGATSNLVFVKPQATAADLESTLLFLLEGRSAFVSGQTWRVAPAKSGDVPGEGYQRQRPLDGRVVVVTGAARGIGAAIARTCARDGARVVAVDVPAAGEALARVANELKGTALQLDITAADAGAKIAAHVAALPGATDEGGSKIWAIVHNAGILRDRMLANLDEKWWAPVLDVNLAAELRMNQVLLDPELPGGLAPQARIVGIASTSGVAGNKGQTNYAASKAGVMGLVWAEAEELADRPITVNAVAPGFIETDMTASIPFVNREIFRRTNSLQQGGNPVDVAETIAWLTDPASGGVNAQIVRVCGQNLVGA